MGAELGPVLETIKKALRADQAKMIEARWVGPPSEILHPSRRPLPAAWREHGKQPTPINEEVSELLLWESGAAAAGSGDSLATTPASRTTAVTADAN
jgi:hypothetical protein